MTERLPGTPSSVLRNIKLLASVVQAAPRMMPITPWRRGSSSGRPTSIEGAYSGFVSQSHSRAARTPRPVTLPGLSRPDSLGLVGTRDNSRARGRDLGDGVKGVVQRLDAALVVDEGSMVADEEGV